MSSPAQWPTVFVSTSNGMRLVTASVMRGDIRLFRRQCWRLPTEPAGHMVHLPYEDRYWTNDPSTTHPTEEAALQNHAPLP